VLDGVERVHQRLAVHGTLPDAPDRFDEDFRCDPVALAEIVNRFHLVREVMANGVLIVLDRRIALMILRLGDRCDRFRAVDLRSVISLRTRLFESESAELRMPARLLLSLEAAGV